MRNAILAHALALAASAFVVAGASAQDVFVDDTYVYDDPMIEDRAYLDDPGYDEEVVIERTEPDPPRTASGTRVYGWQSGDGNATSCGVFMYWDGDRCLDARVDPPDLE